MPVVEIDDDSYLCELEFLTNIIPSVKFTKWNNI